MTTKKDTKTKRISIEEARELSLVVGLNIHWRPLQVAEIEQYALLIEN